MGEKLVFRPNGKIDETNWQAFSDELVAAVSRAEAARQGLRLDLSDVPYMSSRGLRALTLARKAAGDKVEIVLASPNERLREILAISRYDKIFRVEDAGV
jgi:anti-sigma B factor antagonist